MTSKSIIRVGPFDMGKVICDPMEHKGLFISLEDGNERNEFVIVACDNLSGDAFVEEFDSVKEAVLWLNRYRIEQENKQ